VLQALDGTSSFTASKGGAAVPIGVSLVQLDPSSSNMNGSNFQAFAPAPSGLTLSVSLHSDNTSAGTVTSPVTFPAGSSFVTAQFTPGTTAGTAHITAVEPLNFTIPAKSNTVTATVQ